MREAEPPLRKTPFAHSGTNCATGPGSRGTILVKPVEYLSAVSFTGQVLRVHEAQRQTTRPIPIVVTGPT